MNLLKQVFKGLRVKGKEEVTKVLLRGGGGGGVVAGADRQVEEEGQSKGRGACYGEGGISMVVTVVGVDLVVLLLVWLTVMARLQTQEASGSTNLDDDMDSPARCKGETRDSMDSNHGAPRVAGTALRSQLADIKAERMELMCRCQRQEQQVADLRKLVDDIAQLEEGAPDVTGDATWETQSVCSDLSGMSVDSHMPRAVEDMPEADLRELAMWFRSKGGDRRRLLRRYKAGRQKTEALNARKQAGGDLFASARLGKVPARGGVGARSPASDDWVSYRFWSIGVNYKA
eukprot:jgi/Undpi1/10697/HiC_scaffold_29.g13145.m1